MGLVAGLSLMDFATVDRTELVRFFILLLFGRGTVLRFEFGLLIGISFGSAASIAATAEAPPQRRSRRGRIPERPNAQNHRTTAPITAECQSFLDNLVAQLARS